MGYRTFDTDLNDVKLLVADERVDSRGSFTEAFNDREFNVAIGNCVRFVQDNEVHSGSNVLRGLHFQLQHAQGKLVRVLAGEVFDVAVDMRRSSKQFGQWTGAMLSRENRRQLWIPPGFAHGYRVLSANADVLYKTTDYWVSDDEYVVAWDDPIIGIRWPSTVRPVMSARDASAPGLMEVPSFG